MKRRYFLQAGMGYLIAQTLYAQGALAKTPEHSIFSQSFGLPQGGDQAMSLFTDKPVVLNFWASWCPPCVRELPGLDEVQKAHPHIHVLGVAIDTVKNVLRFQEKVEVSYPLLIAGHKGIEIMKTLGNSRAGLPFTVVFDSRQTVVKTFLGELEFSLLEQALAQFSAP